MTTINQDHYYEEAGFTIGVLDDTHLVIEGGFSAMVWQGVAAGYGNDIIAPQNDITIDMTQIGLNGRDAGVPGTPPAGCYKIWLVYNPTTNTAGAIATQTLDIRSIVFPPGFTDNRKMMYGQPVIAGRCLPNHAGNWPMPTIIFTDNDVLMTVVPSIPNAASWTYFDLSQYIPENSRLGLFKGRIAGGVGSIWISPATSVPNPYYTTLLENQSGVSGECWCRVDGNQRIGAWFQGTGTAQLILRGFAMTERS
ncbi:MAG TPA: hypothetical protein VEU47_10955 [Candidatus Cybelea sp.]|nr:hypothetical protein [Candidatus Cybelea sp.]